MACHDHIVPIPGCAGCDRDARRGHVSWSPDYESLPAPGDGAISAMLNDVRLKSIANERRHLLAKMAGSIAAGLAIHYRRYEASDAGISAIGTDAVRIAEAALEEIERRYPP